eukprot:4472580-Pyramimonas_sp.AAC.1
MEHESWSAPPDDEEMRHVWYKTKCHRLGRLAENIAGARLAGLCTSSLEEEAAITAANISF